MAKYSDKLKRCAEISAELDKTAGVFGSLCTDKIL